MRAAWRQQCIRSRHFIVVKSQLTTNWDTPGNAFRAGAQHGVGVANGTGTIELALRAYRIRRGDTLGTVYGRHLLRWQRLKQAEAIPLSVYNLDVNSIMAGIRALLELLAPNR